MPQMRFIVVLGVLLGLIGCGGSPTQPTAPPPAPVPDCQAHNTGTLIIQNNNVLPRNVSVDGAVIGLLPYGNTFTQTVSAGVEHPVVFADPITGRAVSSAQPNVPQCGSYTLTNSF